MRKTQKRLYVGEKICIRVRMYLVIKLEANVPDGPKYPSRSIQ